MTSADGAFISVIRAADFKAHTLLIDEETSSRGSSDNSQFLGGFFNQRFIILHIED